MNKQGTMQETVAVHLTYFEDFLDTIKLDA